MFCVAFGKEPGIIYTGTMSGQIYMWKEQELKEILSNVHSGSLFCLTKHASGFITGGKDSTIRIWDENFAILHVIDLEALIMQHQGEFGTQIESGIFTSLFIIYIYMNYMNYFSILFLKIK